MANIEPQKEPRDVIVPLVAGIILVLVLAGIGYAIYTFIGGPKSRTYKLSDADIKKAGGAAAVANNNNNNGGPPLPASPPLPQVPDPGGTMITLDLKGASLSEVTDAISKQAGVKISTQQNGNVLANLLPAKFDFAVSNEPFWSAVQQLCKARGLYPAPYYYDREQPITLVSGTSPNSGCPILTVGSFKLLFTGITSRFSQDVLASRPPNRQLSVAMTIYVDPKLNPYRIEPSLVIETATDENGANLVRPRDPWNNNNGGQRNKYVATLNGQLQFPDSAGQHIKLLKGYASIIVAGGSESVKIKDPLTATNVDSKIDGQSIRFLHLRKQGDQNYEGQFQGDSNSPLFKDWNNIQPFSKLLDAKGKEIGTQNTWANNIGGKTIGLSAEYFAQNGVGAPTEMEITLPTKLAEIRVPFEFTDLPLPH